MSAPPSELPGGLQAVAVRSLGGGSICRVWDVDLADGRRAVVKQTPYDADLEREGLEALAAAGAPVPTVLASAPDVLVLSHVGGADPTDEDWAVLGGRLAAAHRASAAAGGTVHGWHRDNLLGRLPQLNAPVGDGTSWAAFLAERRVRPLLALAPELPAELGRRIERGLDESLDDLVDHDPPACVLHGDLWPGNVVAGRWLVDPAVARGDRELDLAVARLFGGLPPPFFDGYAEVWALPDGWAERIPLLQLPILLAHVAMFGSGYAGQVRDRITALGW